MGQYHGDQHCCDRGDRSEANHCHRQKKQHDIGHPGGDQGEGAMTKTASIRRRKGSVYVLIIGVSMLAATITIAASLAGRAQSRALDGANNAAEARLYAQAAIDLGRLYIKQDSSWRANRTNGRWINGLAIG